MVFPKASSKSVIMVVVERIHKYAHFFSLQHQFTLAMVTQLFLDHIFKRHGITTSIVSDRDPTFTSKFWQELFKLQGTQLNMRTSYHPQIDGQMEEVNKRLEMYFNFFNSKMQHQWVQQLRLDKWRYNTTYHDATKMTSYESVYVKQPLPLLLIFQELPRFRQWRIFFNKRNGHWKLSRIILSWLKTT